jgi:four helix bundle protein
MRRAVAQVVRAKCLEELRIYQQALDAAHAVSAMVRRESFRRDLKLRGQLLDVSDGVAASISEGFGQLTDRHFAHYLCIARGSANEARTHLSVAHGRGHITADERAAMCDRYDEIGRGLTRFIQYLTREDRTTRG